MQDKNHTENIKEKSFTKRITLSEKVCVKIESIAKANSMDQDNVVEHLLFLGMQKAYELSDKKKADKKKLKDQKERNL